MYDPIARALTLLDAEAPKKSVVSRPVGDDPRARLYEVPTMNGRRQVVQANAVKDSLFGERLDLLTIGVREMPIDANLLVGLLRLSRDFRRARLCFLEGRHPQLAVVASFVPDVVDLVGDEGSGPRLLHALREVASIADSLETQIVGADVE
jgi:hypothetical protein